MATKEQRSLAADLLAEGWSSSAVGSYLGVTPETVNRWRDDPEFIAEVEKHQAQLQMAAERGRIKVLLEFDNLVGDAIAIARDPSSKSQPGMIRYLIDKVWPTVTVTENHTTVEADVRFWKEIDSRLGKVLELRADTAKEPKLVQGSDAVASYGLIPKGNGHTPPGDPPVEEPKVDG